MITKNYKDDVSSLLDILGASFEINLVKSIVICLIETNIVRSFTDGVDGAADQVHVEWQ